MTQTTGDWFSRYKFRQPLGQGGMGVIYLAEDKARNNALCVVKQLIMGEDEPDEHAEAVRLFEREASVLSKLQHQGIVRLFDQHVTEDGKYFLVMDYVPGENLANIVKTYGAFSSEATVEIGIQCCEVLEYLHRLKPPILYRDLKPSNIMLTPEGRIVFIDFGIARDFAPKQVATRVVTTGYSPPEQYFGRPEIRSDLYALGATLGELLTAIRPKPLTMSVPKHLNRSVLSSLDDLIQRLTSHDPEYRPRSARSVRYELYHIYNEIHPEFIVPQEAPYLDPNRAPTESLSDEEDFRPDKTRPRYKSRSQAAASGPQSQNRIKSAPKTGPQTAQIDNSILWNGIRRILEIFRF